MSAAAEFERTRIAERMTEGRKAKRARGGRIGSVPFGYRAEGKGKASMLVEDEREQLVVARIVELNKAPSPAKLTAWQRRCDRASKKGDPAPKRPKPLSTRLIALKLAAEGHVSRSGKPFAHMQIQRILVHLREKEKGGGGSIEPAQREAKNACGARINKLCRSRRSLDFWRYLLYILFD
jgi:hypothetical protein